MSEKNIASTLATSLVPLGALALAAGCGGGGAAVSPAAPHNNAPGTSGTNSVAGPMVTAQLTVTVPARGTQLVKRSKPQYISPGSGAIGVSVAVGSASPAPQQLFTLPTPGPAPVTTTLPVQAPVGTDTIAVNVYDVSPAATASPNLLSSGSTQTVISPTALNTPSVTTLGVAGGVVLSLANNPTPAPNGTARPWTPLENVSGAQSVTINATAVDVLGFTISGTLATAAPIVATGPVTLSAPSVTTASSTLTATYPAHANTAGTIGSTLPINSGSPTDNVAVQPDYGVFAGGSNVVVIDGVDHTVTTVLNPAVVTNIAAASCAGGAVAVAPDNGNVDIVTVAPSTTANPVPAPKATMLAVPGLTGSSGVVFDSACNAYVGAISSGNLYIEKVSGFGGTPSATQIQTLPALPSGSPASGFNLSVAANTLYVGESGGFPTVTGATYSVPLPNGGSATNIDSNLRETVAVSGSTLFRLRNGSGTSCDFTGPFLQDLQASQGLLSGATTTAGIAVQPLAVAPADGTLYANQPGGAPGSGVYDAFPPLAGGAWLPLANVILPVAFALSPDPANTYFCDANSNPTNEVSFYLRAQLGSAQTPASVALSFAPNGLAAAP